MINKYRVKSFYYKSYSDKPVVKYKIQKRVMGFWSDMESNYETTDKEYVNRICEELNIPYQDNEESTYFIYVKQTKDQQEANLADLTIVNQKTRVIRHRRDAVFTPNKIIMNKDERT